MFFASELLEKDTISSGKFGELKVETRKTRVWFNPGNNKVSIETPHNGKWKFLYDYEAR